MNICVFSRVVRGHSKGGVQDHIVMLTEGFTKKGHKVTVISSRHPEKVHENVNWVDIYYAKKGAVGNYSKGYFEESVKLFKKLNEKEGFDIVHSQDVSAYGLIKAKIKIPVVVTMQGTSYDELKTRLNNLSISEPVVSLREMAIFLIFVYRYFARELPMNRKVSLIATSNEQAKVYKKIYSNKKVFKVYNGIDLKLFFPEKTDDLKNKLNLKGKKILLCIARFEKEKGIQNILRAMPHIVKKRKEVKLLLVGDGYYKKRLKEIANKLKLKEYVEFCGYIDFKELNKYFNLCDIFINPTNRQNGYDLTVIEAMACQKPVITTDIGSYPTAIESKKDGILTRLKDEKQLANAVLNLLENEEFRKTISKNARKKVLKLFTAENMVNGTLDVYERVIENER